MATLSSIVTDALRESGILALGESPATEAAAEGVTRLGVIIRSVFGHEVGEGLNPISYEVYKDTIDSAYAPANARVFFELTDDTTINLDPNPCDGARFAVIDIAGNFATNSLTLDGNGRLIEGLGTLVLTTNSLNREWFFRADTGSWVRVSDLISTDALPFPTEFEDYFVTALAIRLNPRYGQEIPPSTIATMNRTESRMRARYSQKQEEYSDVALLSLAAHKNWFITGSEFKRGNPWNY